MTARARRAGALIASAAVLAALASAANEAPAPAPLAPVPGWPIWLETPDGRHTRETSGLAFVGRDGEGRPVFLAVDDRGTLWRVTVSEATATVALDSLPFSGSANEVLARLPKRDLESIAYSPLSMRVLISIEGNDPPKNLKTGLGSYRDQIGIYVAILDNPDPLEATCVVALEQLKVVSWRSAIRLATSNRAFEGMAVREDTLVVGLEGVLVGKEGFADSTVIEVWDLGEKTWREYSTKSLGIATVTALEAGPEGRWYGIDRNSLLLFSFRLGESGVEDFRSVPVSFPGVRGVPYILPSPEALALDDSGGIWIAIDPWKYKPATTKGLTQHDVANYDAMVPMLYKYPDPFARAAGD